MERFKSYLFSSTGFVLLLACFVLAYSSYSTGEASNHASTADTTDVNVVNKPSVTVDNIPTVKLAENTTVQIGNLASLPLKTRNAVVPINLGGEIGTVSVSPRAQNIFTVPLGKRLVIEYASVTKNNNVLTITLIATAGRSVGRFPLGDSQLVRIYADPNTLIAVTTTCSPPCDLRGTTVNISGYLEDAQ